MHHISYAYPETCKCGARVFGDVDDEGDLLEALSDWFENEGFTIDRDKISSERVVAVKTDDDKIDPSFALYRRISTWLIFVKP